MKQHRLQDCVEPIVRAKWPVKPFKQKEKEEEEEEEIGADMGPCSSDSGCELGQGS
ncbi:hypothetical protein MC885_013689, partial [Smutsia gigantea]